AAPRAMPPLPRAVARTALRTRSALLGRFLRNRLTSRSLLRGLATLLPESLLQVGLRHRRPGLDAGLGGPLEQLRLRHPAQPVAGARPTAGRAAGRATGPPGPPPARAPGPAATTAA